MTTKNKLFHFFATKWGKDKNILWLLMYLFSGIQMNLCNLIFTWNIDFVCTLPQFIQIFCKVGKKLAKLFDQCALYVVGVWVSFFKYKLNNEKNTFLHYLFYIFIYETRKQVRQNNKMNPSVWILVKAFFFQLGITKLLCPSKK